MRLHFEPTALSPALLFWLLISLAAGQLEARQTWERDLAFAMEIPMIMAMESSPTHLYVLSAQEGLVVFRAYPDSLQWLYSSEGMERRGDRLRADIRFAYLYGDSERLTVVEPTSVLGVYSSTTLPARPLAVQRLDNHLYIAMGDYGFGRLSLETPEQLDSTPEPVLEEQLDGRMVRDVVSDQIARLYLLAGERDLFILDQQEADSRPELNRRVELDRPATALFLTDDELIGADEQGALFLIDADGSTRTIAEAGEAVKNVRALDNLIALRTETGVFRIGEPGGRLHQLGEAEGGNHFTLLDGRFWIAEYDRIAPLFHTQSDGTAQRAGTDEQPRLAPIRDRIIPYPRPLILPIELASGHDPADIELSYRSEVRNARIRGQSFNWQPASNQTGRHRFTIVASTTTGLSDEVEFTVDVRPFNSPPRFTSIPPQTISAEETFSLEIHAFDPDGSDPDLIRYLGVDLPTGVSLDERTGEIRWTLTLRQVGNHEFQVIATDQFGAAASTDVRIRVIETDPEQEAEIDLDGESFD